MAGYQWYYNDNDPQIMAGVNNTPVIYVGIIQNPAPYGGRNVEFRLTNSLSLYHVH